MNEAQQRSRDFNEAVKAELIAGVKRAAAGAFIKADMTGEKLEQAKRTVQALVDVLEEKPAALFLGSQYEGDKGLMLLIRENFPAAQKKAGK